MTKNKDSLNTLTTHQIVTESDLWRSSKTLPLNKERKEDTNPFPSVSSTQNCQHSQTSFWTCRTLETELDQWQTTLPDTMLRENTKDSMLMRWLLRRPTILRSLQKAEKIKPRMLRRPLRKAILRLKSQLKVSRRTQLLQTSMQQVKTM